MRRPQRGLSLIELMIVIAVIGMIAAICFPKMMTLQRRAATRNAAAELRGMFHSLRMRAIARANFAGVKFTKAADGVWTYALYDDGDRDGVRSDDIASGVDRCYQATQHVLAAVEKRAFIGLPPLKIIDPDGDPLPPTKAPVNFNNSTICSFSALGESTPGTVYVTDGIDDVYAVRVYGMTGRIRVLRWMAAKKKWELK